MAPGRVIVAQPTVFDQPYQRGYTEARIAFLREILPELKAQMDLRTALDLGCGVGYFSNALHSLGLKTIGVDGRPDNAREAGERHAEIAFHVADVEGADLCRMGTFDLVLCFGLLYHLENPLLAVRNMFSLCGKLLLLESMRNPSKGPSIIVCDEWQQEDQALREVAFYPSEACIVKMLYRAGFRHVYRFNRFPRHIEFRSTFTRKRQRTLMAASRVPIVAPFLSPVRDVSNTPDLWATPPARAMRSIQRGWGFLRKPWPDKMATLRRLFHAN